MKLEFRSKNEIVYQQLRKSIIQGDFKPGTRLVIDQLALELGVSQIPIREAVRQLEADGFRWMRQCSSLGWWLKAGAYDSCLGCLCPKMYCPARASRAISAGKLIL